MDAESLTHIAGLNPLTQTGRLFDAVCTAFTAAPGQEKVTLHVRNGTHRWRSRVYRSNVLTAYSCPQPLRRRMPIDPVTYAERHHSTAAIVVWPFDDEPPVLPGGWQILTPENQNVMTTTLRVYVHPTVRSIAQLKPATGRVIGRLCTSLFLKMSSQNF